jgi:hypothetical protein
MIDIRIDRSARADNVYLLKVVIQIAGTRLWLRMTNTTGTEPEEAPTHLGRIGHRVVSARERLH